MGANGIILQPHGLNAFFSFGAWHFGERELELETGKFEFLKTLCQVWKVWLNAFLIFSKTNLKKCVVNRETQTVRQKSSVERVCNSKETAMKRRGKASNYSNYHLANTKTNWKNRENLVELYASTRLSEAWKMESWLTKKVKIDRRCLFAQLPTSGNCQKSGWKWAKTSRGGTYLDMGWLRLSELGRAKRASVQSRTNTLKTLNSLLPPARISIQLQTYGWAGRDNLCSSRSCGGHEDWQITEGWVTNHAERKITNR